MQTEEFARASNVIIWNKRFLNCLGLWSTTVNQPLFVLSSVYVAIHCIMGANHLIKYFNQPVHVIANLSENVLFVMLLGKLLVYRYKSGIMTNFLKFIKNDFSVKTYNSVREKTAYLYYNELALIFMIITMSLSSVSATLFYAKIFLVNLDAITSGNFSYELPYRVQPFFEIKDTSTYVCVCIYLFIAVPIITCGYAGPDAFVLSMILHICGQFATLSCKVDDLLKNRENYRRHVGSIVIKHRNLIILTEILENNFNMIFLQQTLGTVLLLCLTLYHMIASSEYGNNFYVIMFMLYTCCVCSTIIGYCYIGECLITESAGLRDAFYNSKWYNNPPSHTKLISICMVRAEKPLMLTCGKFYMLSLNTFTSIVKTSVAYLSVLRNFM